MPDIALPDWPARMPSDLAAAYLAIGESTFFKRVAPLLPKVRIGATVGYRRTDLDRWLAMQGDTPLPAPAQGPADQVTAAQGEWDAALGAAG